MRSTTAPCGAAASGRVSAVCQSPLSLRPEPAVATVSHMLRPVQLLPRGLQPRYTDEQADAMTTKETVRAILDRLPDNCSIDDVLYQLYVVQAVGRGDADIAAGRTVSHERVDADLRRKWLLGAGR